MGAPLPHHMLVAVMWELTPCACAPRWVDKNDAKRMSFFRRQVEVTKNIVNPPWLDWPVAHPRRPPTHDRRRE